MKYLRSDVETFGVLILSAKSLPAWEEGKDLFQYFLTEQRFREKELNKTLVAQIYAIVICRKLLQQTRNIMIEVL